MHRFGIIGSGSIGKKHAQSLLSIPNCQLVAISASKLDNAIKLAHQFQCQAQTTEELVRNSSVDYIIIASPTHLHYQHILLAFQENKPALCEKPFTNNIDQASEILSILDKDPSKRLMIAHVLRFFPQYRLAKDYIENNQLGKIKRVVLKRLTKVPQGSENWFLDYQKSGGVILDLMIHDIDYALWIFGEPVDMEIIFNEANPKNNKMQANIMFYYHDKEINILGSWEEEHFSHTIDIYGSEAFLSFNPYTNTLRLEEHGIIKEEVDCQAYADPYVAQIKHFIEWIEGKTELLIPPEQAYRTLKYTLQLRDRFQAG